MARDPIKKSIRFEVFKRDCFTCQYCGSKAPDVVLEIDHITPVAAGGDSHIMNLVTACVACNSGKSDKLLSDSAMVQKARAQAEDTQERIQQIEMIAQWHLSLVDIDVQSLLQLERLWLDSVKAGADVSLVQSAKDELLGWLKRYGFELVCRAIVKNANNLIERGVQENQEERNAAFWLIPKICSVTRADDNDPGVARLFYIRGILRKRCQYLNDGACIAFLIKARDAGINAEEMVTLAKQVFSWTQFRDAVDHEISKYE